eukprot:scaffold165414_cov33-Cyclotella_meneghiniana.AAC.2
MTAPDDACLRERPDCSGFDSSTRTPTGTKQDHEKENVNVASGNDSTAATVKRRTVPVGNRSNDSKYTAPLPNGSETILLTSKSNYANNFDSKSKKPSHSTTRPNSLIASSSNKLTTDQRKEDSSFQDQRCLTEHEIR